MPRLLSSVLSLRRDPRLLKLPPYLSLLCIIVGIASLVVLPLDSYSRRTYISENALLPGQVHTYFGGSDQNVFRAYKHEVTRLEDKTNVGVNDKLESILKGVGLKVARQNFTYTSSGTTHSGQNVYAILQAPRGDATEAIVLLAPWRNVKDEFNSNGVALALTLARYFRRWSLWSKDIIFLLPPDALAGPQAWVDAYHDAHDPSRVAALPLKSGALQGAVAIDYAAARGESRFESVHIAYDGTNGQLPNLDLINSVVNIAGGQMGMGVSLQEMWRHDNGYRDRLRTMLRGMFRQAVGAATGAHSCFMAYHVDAVTLSPFGEGWQDEMAMGRVVEGTFRSLNNLLEHLHQSFFFYLLMHKERFVSIGTYLPSAMLVAVNFSIMSIAAWFKSGQAGGGGAGAGTAVVAKAATEGDAGDKKKADSPTQTLERELFLPLGVVASCQFLGAVPLYLFNHLSASLLQPAFLIFTALNAALPHIISFALTTRRRQRPATAQQYELIKCFSLLLLGMFLSSLATLNFSLAFVVGLLATPLTFTRPFFQESSSRWTAAALLNLASPPVVLIAACAAWRLDVGEVLREAAFGWDVWGMYTAVVVWCVWWPAWLAGSVVVLGRPAGAEETKKAKAA